MAMMINTDTLSLLNALSKEEFFKVHRATLIGGTALAYHFGHRVSYDIDIAFPFGFDLPKLTFLENYNFTKIDFDRFIQDSWINDGGDIDESIQRYVDNTTGVKVDFVINPGSNIYESQILKDDNEATIFNNITIASPNTLFKLKSLLLIDRNKLRDLYDIHYLINHENYKPKDILDTIKQYKITYDDTSILSLLSHRKPDELDILTEPIVQPKAKLTEYDELINSLIGDLKKLISFNMGFGR